MSNIMCSVCNTQEHISSFSFCLSLQNYFARNFYNMRMLALFVAFAINFILLFYKVMAQYIPGILLAYYQ